MVHCNHIETLTADMETRFCDLFELEIPDWVFDTFIDIDDVDEEYQNEIIGLRMKTS